MAEYLAEDLSAEVQAKMDELAQKGNQLETGAFYGGCAGLAGGVGVDTGATAVLWPNGVVFGGDWRRLFSAGRICAGARML